jgi:hypothetical protein
MRSAGRVALGAIGATQVSYKVRSHLGFLPPPTSLKPPALASLQRANRKGACSPARTPGRDRPPRRRRVREKCNKNVDRTGARGPEVHPVFVPRVRARALGYDLRSFGYAVGSVGYVLQIVPERTFLGFCCPW